MGNHRVKKITEKNISDLTGKLLISGMRYAFVLNVEPATNSVETHNFSYLMFCIGGKSRFCQNYKHSVDSFITWTIIE